jgi:hypothetical protein
LPRPPRDIGERGPFVAPGVYTVTLDVDGITTSRPVTVKPDPLLPVSVAQHRERESFLLEVSAAQHTAGELGARISALRSQLVQRRAANARPNSQSLVDSALARLSTIERAVRVGPAAVQGRVYSLAGEFNGQGAQQGSLHPPTRTHRERFALLLTLLTRAQEELAALEAISGSIQD